MRIFNKFKGTKGFVSVWHRVIRFQYMITEEAKQRTKILAFWEEYGTEAVEKAFGTKRRTLFLWRRSWKRVVENSNPSIQSNVFQSTKESEYGTLASSMNSDEYVNKERTWGKRKCIHSSRNIHKPLVFHAPLFLPSVDSSLILEDSESHRLNLGTKVKYWKWIGRKHWGNQRISEHCIQVTVLH